jgi:Rieske Fe-S protein
MTMGNLLAPPLASTRRGSAKVPSEGRKRRPPSRICTHEGCEQYVVDQGLCVRHGVRVAVFPSSLRLDEQWHNQIDGCCHRGAGW